MEGTSLMTLKGMNVMVGSVARESRQVQVLLCLLLAMRSWASHFPRDSVSSPAKWGYQLA